MSKVYTGFDCVVKFRCSSALRDAIRDGARASGMDISTYIRACLWRVCPLVCQNAQTAVSDPDSLVVHNAQNAVQLAFFPEFERGADK